MASVATPETLTDEKGVSREGKGRILAALFLFGGADGGTEGLYPGAFVGEGRRVQGVGVRGAVVGVWFAGMAQLHNEKATVFSECLTDSHSNTVF